MHSNQRGFPVFVPGQNGIIVENMLNHASARAQAQSMTSMSEKSISRVYSIVSLFIQISYEAI
jgi:hypothetical protein